jgi:hypothetical protein
VSIVSRLGVVPLITQRTASVAYRVPVGDMARPVTEVPIGPTTVAPPVLVSIV